MARQKGSLTGRCLGCNHPERVRIERFLAAGASIKGTARKFEIDYHALRRHWTNHVSAEARASYAAGAGATKDQLEQFVADESIGLLDHYRIVRGALYKGFSAAAELGDGNAVALLAGRLHENFRDCGRLTGELQRANFGVSDRRFRFKPAGGFGGNRQAVSVQSGTPLRMGFGPDFGEPPLRDTSYLAVVCQSKYSCHYL